MSASAPPSPSPRQPVHGSLSHRLSDDAQHRLAELAARLTAVQNVEIDLDWDFLVKRWFLARETSIVYAPSNLGKSTFVIDLASAVVSGESWHGYRTRRGIVLYIAAESAISVIERAKPFLKEDAASFLVLDDRVDLFGAPEDIDALAALVESIGAGAGAGEPVALIVIDTLTLCMGDGDENSNADAVRVTRSATRLAEFTGAHVLMVHHTGKDRASGPRGASGLVGNVDTAIELAAVEKDGEKLVRAVQVKQRRMPKTEAITFRIVPALLGYDSEGEPRTISAIEAVASGELLDLGQPAPRNRRAEAILRTVIDLEGTAAPEQRVAGFTASEIAEASFRRLAAGMKLDSWKKAVRTALSELAADPAVLLALEGGRFARPVPPTETKH